MRAKELLKVLAIPLIALFVYFIFYILWLALGFPSQEEIAAGAKELFSKYGLWIVFVGAFIEGLLLFGNYFPGGFIIFLGVISAGKDITRVLQILILVSVAFFISYAINYLLGKYGWYKLFVKFGLSKLIEKYKNKLEKQGLSLVFFTYWIPSFAALTATAAGILRIDLKKFLIYSAFGIIVWSLFWGTLIYFLGQAALEILGLKFVIIFFVIWIGIIIFRHLYKKSSLL